MPLAWKSWFANGWYAVSSTLAAPAEIQQGIVAGNDVYTNVFSDPSFETGFTGWNTNNGGETRTLDTAQAHSGTHSLKLQTPGLQTAEGLISPITATGSAAIGDYWVGAIWVFSSAGGEVMQLQLNERNAAGSPLGGTTVLATLAAGWQKLRVARTLSLASVSKVSIKLVTNSTRAITIWLDDASLGQGQSAVIETLQAITRTGADPLEATKTLQVVAAADPAEAPQAITATGLDPLEAPKALTITGAEVAEALRALAITGSSDPLEATKTLQVAAGADPAEAPQAIAATRLDPLESTKALRTSSLFADEAAQAIASSKAFPYEAPGSVVIPVSQTAQLPIETTTALKTTVAMPLESLADIRASAADALETLAAIRASSGAAPLETLQRIAASTAVAVESLRALRVPTMAGAEALARVSSSLSAALESLRSLRVSAADPIDSERLGLNGVFRVLLTDLALTALLLLERRAGELLASSSAGVVISSEAQSNALLLTDSAAIALPLSED